MKYDKHTLLKISGKISEDEALTVSEYTYISGFQKPEKDSLSLIILKQATLPLSLFFGMLLYVFPDFFNSVIQSLPPWTNFSPTMLRGVDYLWDIIGDPVKKENIIYHLPNVVFYSFGIVGIKKIFESLDKQTWIDKVRRSQGILQERTKSGTMRFKLRKGHSVLFVGDGDHIGKQFVLNHSADETVTIGVNKPDYTDIWNFYNTSHSYDDLKDVLVRISGKHTGEYVFFPVKDTQVFLPASAAYDLSPHKLDILCQNIRKIENEHHITPRRIIIIGDKNHHSFVQSEDKKGVIKNSHDTISLHSISVKYKNITLLDPTDIALKQILKQARGRRIVFRATKEGIAEFKKRFYQRLEELGYRHTKKKKGIFTVGYDLFEDQTEQQTLSGVVDDYYPVVISKSVRDALVRNGYKNNEFLYVPELVLDTLNHVASEQ